MKSVLEARHFHDEEAAYNFVERRIWPNGPVCPKCKETKRIGKLAGKSTRIGVYKCYVCRKPFSVKVGTVFESSHIPMRHWLQAMYLMASSKKGISTNQLQRTFGCTLKTAWFMSHRIREAMRQIHVEPLGGAGKTVEIDETLMGFQEGVNSKMKRPSGQFRNVVLTLVERGGSSRSFHIEGPSHGQLMPIIRANVQRESIVMTDEAQWYNWLGGEFFSHDTVMHSAKEYVRDDISTNTVEGYYSVFKRGMKGIYQHCAEKHLHRYLAEFDFRYSNRVALGVNDVERADIALKGIVGKRLKYKATSH
jgi:transposase-like protein